jgi:hypothetical protein
LIDGEGHVTLKIDRNGRGIERRYTIDGNVVWQRARKVTGEERKDGEREAMS